MVLGGTSWFQSKALENWDRTNCAVLPPSCTVLPLYDVLHSNISLLFGLPLSSVLLAVFLALCRQQICVVCFINSTNRFARGNRETARKIWKDAKRFVWFFYKKPVVLTECEKRSREKGISSLNIRSIEVYTFNRNVGDIVKNCYRALSFGL